MEYKKYNIIKFGSYWQDETIKSGKKPIEWIILDVKDDKILLLSRYILDNLPFDEYDDTISENKVTWKESSLRRWLNNVDICAESFINNAFSDNEKELIIDTNLEAEENSFFCNGKFGENTFDKIFLLTMDDVIYRYFKTDENRIAYPTKYVKANNVICSAKKFSNNHGVFWWLRNRGKSNNCVSYIDETGRIVLCGIIAKSNIVFVRPALWMKI